MQYFDFNIPYNECSPSTKMVTDKSTKKQNRLKLVVKAMELGYAGVAYDCTMKGVMSETDRCSIFFFPLSSLLSISPTLSSAASLHRRLLGTRLDSPFRQYSRLTVIVDDHCQTTALNSGNAILKTYDLVAARPMNQKAFEQICQFSEVDLIAIDFSDKLPFRLKSPMVKAAISRGVYFEITYSGLVRDVQVRRQLITNAKLLVDWTRGKNLIVSSAAPSVLEFRGPNDVANLLSLLGLANEHAKAAISKNCRSLIAKAIRKKQFYKELIKVESMPSGSLSDPTKPWNSVDSLEWDPISSEGDLVLDDLAKSFSEAVKASKPAKALNFDPVMNNKDSNFLSVKHVRPGTVDESLPPDGALDIVIDSRSVISSDAEKASVSHFREPMSMFSKVDQKIASDNLRTSFSSEPFRLCTSSKASISDAIPITCEVKKSADPVSSILPSRQPDMPNLNYGFCPKTGVLDTDTGHKFAKDVVENGGQLDDSDVKVCTSSEKGLKSLGIQNPSTSEEVIPIMQKEEENCAKNRHPSRGCSKSAKDKFKRRGLRFPFKNVFQIPSKKKSAASRLKIKK